MEKKPNKLTMNQEILRNLTDNHTGRTLKLNKTTIISICALCTPVAN